MLVKPSAHRLEPPPITISSQHRTAWDGDGAGSAGFFRVCPPLFLSDLAGKGVLLFTFLIVVYNI